MFLIPLTSGGIHHGTHPTSAMFWRQQEVAVPRVGTGWNGGGSAPSHHHRTTHRKRHFHNEAQSRLQYYLL